MFSTLAILAYFTPETMLPLSSVIATVVGFGLLVQRSSIRFVVGLFRAAFRRRSTGTSVKAPHFSAETRRETQKGPAAGEGWRVEGDPNNRS